MFDVRMLIKPNLTRLLCLLPLVGFLWMIAYAQIAEAQPKRALIEKILRHIDSGELKEAREALSSNVDVGHRSPGELIQMARLESRGERAHKYLTSALTNTVYPRDRERIYLKLGRYHQAGGDLASLRTVIDEYKREFRQGEFRTDFARFEIYLAERNNDFELARSLSRSLEKSSSRIIRDWARLNLARYKLNSKKLSSSGRRSVLKLSGSSSDQIAPLALYLLARTDFVSRRFDEAALNFNILQEAYPGAVGTYDLVEFLSELDPNEGGSSGEAEALVGTRYSVQVGVFVEYQNAKNQRKKLSPFGKPVEIVRKTISGKKYYAVYIGSFSTIEAAQALKVNLERSERELFTIVLR